MNNIDNGWYCTKRAETPHSFVKFQKQPAEESCKKTCSQKCLKILRKTPVPESLLNKVAGLRSATLLKKRLRHRCFPVNFAEFLKTPFLQNTSERLLAEFPGQETVYPSLIWVLGEIEHFFQVYKIFEC